MRGRSSHQACGLYAHVTWHTWRRIAQVRKSDVPVVTATVLDAARRWRVHVHAQAVLSDHVHLVVRYPAHVPLASFIRHSKSESSRRINSSRVDAQRVQWCRGYYAGSLSRRDVGAARSYLAMQFQRHPNRIPR